jgi:hypothetical protein
MHGTGFPAFCPGLIGQRISRDECIGPEDSRRRSRRGVSRFSDYPNSVNSFDRPLQRASEPVRVAGLKLGRQDRARARLGMGPAPDQGLVSQRLRILREWRWSSYRAHAGYSVAPKWLTQEPLGRICGGKSQSERERAFRDYHEAPVREGLVASPWEELVAGVVLGTKAFARSLRLSLRGDRREQRELRELSKGASWEEIVKAVEGVRGEAWEDIQNRHGDWGRDAALWLGRQVGRLKLGELGERVGGMEYGAVGQAVRRFGARLEKETKLKKRMESLKTQLLHV